MVVRLIPTLLAAATAVALVVSPSSSTAAEFTDLLDAADPQTDTTWDFHIEPSFRFDISSGDIAREAVCIADHHPQFTDNPLAERRPERRLNRSCPGPDDGPTIVHDEQMNFRQTRSTMDMTLRGGLYRDLELRLNFPYVVQSSRSLRYHSAGGGANTSSVDPTDDDIAAHAAEVFQSGSFQSNVDEFEMYRFFELGNDYGGFDRSGFADPSVGIHWAPWNDYRDDTKSTMVLGVDYTMPLATPQQAGNSSVGRGVHEFAFKFASSRRFDWIEPYFGAQYFLPVAATESLYGQRYPDSEGQVLTLPPHRGLFTIGTEFIPFEDPTQDVRYAIDLRFQFGYTSEGRDYTPLFDHMTHPSNECNGVTIDELQPEFDSNGELVDARKVHCAWVAQQPTNFDDGNRVRHYDLENDDGSNPYQFTDLMSVDSYGTFSGQIGFYLQPHELFQFRTALGLTRHQSHLLTNARTGRAIEGDEVDIRDYRERNPVYNPAYDNSGDRFRIQSYNTFHFIVTTALQF